MPRRFPETTQHFVPRDAEGFADAAEDVDTGVGGSRLDALHVAPIDFRQARQIILSQSALHAQAVDIFAENGARRRTHPSTLPRRTGGESGLIVAFSSLCGCALRISIPVGEAESNLRPLRS